ncbi:phosphatidate cytidylyltransferase [Candidatus Palibaumannia cicadellinicola]|uniref:Phosphatidate cytidylyltransferase n=1 Tax=Candidatus Palibaumannia cicadellinicola TaxID=186490 RepID=A0A2N4XXE6_9GAMM|nr:phosphatidate cytidylyltransferase [Candidatus Baumannia cicadellinicola]PLK59135.1 phosphatidate cytidylyltransferase [Candidatus Baumannia cicadellinicola]
MLKYRLITAFIIIPIVIGILFLLPPIWFKLVTLTVCMLSAWEWGQLAGLNDFSKRFWLTIVYGLLLTVITFAVPIYWPLFIVWQVQYVLLVALLWWLTALILVLCYPNYALFWCHSHLLRLAFGFFTILPFFCSVIILLDYNYDINHFAGSWWLLYIMFLVWSADSGAYLFGRALGSHKLAPNISPGKTWEGLISGLLISLIISWIFNSYAPLHVAPLTLLVCSTVAALASVVGDLTESMFKREAGIKDSGYIIPGHGGMLDRIDSLTAAIPVFVYLMLQVCHADIS